ncbi:hypothetical protein ARMSODRAFT_1011556 [Armillaria solidipes]|uniref:Uncharacterized protein n=1 Tax=Armillaria solidipes TaxID=1076256 RepID=A0A2H3CHQ3_9AGAR|nr:hypothetical protein ARMSODRAFT_1011556 [Armillaria solidipes]
MDWDLWIGSCIVSRSMYPTPSSSKITLECVVLFAGINTTEYHRGRGPQGGLDTLNIVLLGYLDLTNLGVYPREAKINGKLGIPVNATGLTQEDVPATYDTLFNKQGSS